ncbi:hypothetical protein STEG23_017811 [Scotinomys teguina]
MRHICSWQHRFTSERRIDIEDTPYEVYLLLLFGKNSYLSKKLFLPGLLDKNLVSTGHAGSTERWQLKFASMHNPKAALKSKIVAEIQCSLCDTVLYCEDSPSAQDVLANSTVELWLKGMTKSTLLFANSASVLLFLKIVSYDCH